MKHEPSPIVVITGASGGIGQALSLQFLDEGANLYMVGRSEPSLNLSGRHAQCPSSQMHWRQADLTDEEDLCELERKLKADLDHIDILIHCAGILTLGRIEDASVSDLDDQYRTNVRAPYSLTKGLLPLLKACEGQIVFLNSSIWQHARAGISQYAASKYALKAITDSLREEVNADGIRVLSVYLGRTATPMQKIVHAEEGRPYHPEHLIQPDDVAATILHILKLPRTLEVTDIHIRPMKKASSGR